MPILNLRISSAIRFFLALSGAPVPKSGICQLRVEALLFLRCFVTRTDGLALANASKIRCAPRCSRSRYLRTSSSIDSSSPNFVANERRYDAASSTLYFLVSIAIGLFAIFFSPLGAGRHSR